MAKKVEIKKTVFDKKEYRGIIDSKFKFFREPEPVVDPDTIEELFRLYDKLYALIPIEGEERTHQYLVERSSELYQIDTQLENIQPLLDEVSSLRRQILESNRRILELETKLAGGGELNFEDAEQMQLLRTQLETANATIATLEQANTLANKATEMVSKQAADAAKKAEDAAKTSADAQAKAAADAAKNASADATATAELVGLMKKKNTDLYHARKFIEKVGNYYSMSRNYWQRRSFGSWYITRHHWLYADNDGEREFYSSRRWRGYSRSRNYNYFIPKSKNEAGDMTADFLIDECKQGGFKAKEIIAAINSFGKLKKRITTRVITYKDPDKEDGIGYNYTG